MKGWVARVAMATMSIGLSGFSTVTTAEPGTFSAGFKTGKALITIFDGFSEIDSDEGVPVGFNVGYSFAPDWTIEFEYVSGSVEVSGPARNLDTDVTSTAVYAAYRSPDTAYLVGRVGFASVRFESDIGPHATESGTSFSLGAGYRLLPNLALEADYTMVEEDVDWLMLSLRYDFP